jgi:hypothetical protein
MVRRPTAIGTLVERSELVMLLHLPHDSLDPFADVGTRSRDARLGIRIHRRQIEMLVLMV